MRTVVEAIAATAKAGAGALTVLWGGNEQTMAWEQVYDRARRLATLLSGLGIGQGSRVGLLGDTSVDMVVAIQAVWLRGAAISMLPPAPRRADPLWRGAIIANAKLDLVLADSEFDVADVRVLSLSRVAEESAALPPADVVLPEPADLAILQHTSGSTSEPHGVPVTHGHLAANLDAIKGAFGYGGESIRMFSWLPLYHDMGLIGFTCLPMACGWQLVLQTPTAFALRPMSWLEALSRYQITTSGAPDFAFRLVTPLLGERSDLDLSPLRFLLCGGEPIAAEAMARFATAGQRCGLDPAAIVPAYGLAESTLAVSISRPGAGLLTDVAQSRRLVRLGSAVPGTTIRIVDPHTGETAGQGQVGLIEVQGPSVIGHYWGQPPPPPGSWLNTGDLGYLTDDGELVVCGRQKDVLFAAGRNVYPQDAEAAAARVPAVRPGGAVAFGVPNLAYEGGDHLIVAVEVRGADALTVRRAVAAAVSGQIGMSPAEVVTLTPGRIPKTSSGKLRRAEARRRYLNGELTERTVQ